MRTSLLYILSLFLVSCGEEFALTKKEYFLDPKVKAYRIDTDEFKKMEFKNSQNQTETFEFEKETEDTNFSKTSIIGIPTKIDKYEQISQIYRNKSAIYQTQMVAFDVPGNQFLVNLGGTIFYLLIGQKTIFTIINMGQNFSNPNFSGGQGRINSTFEIIDDYESSGKKYSNVIKLILNDGPITENTFTEIYIAPRVGLMQYKRNGETYFRTNL